MIVAEILPENPRCKSESGSLSKRRLQKLFLAPLLTYCLVRGLFLKHMPALVFGMLYGYAIIWAFSRRGCNRLLVEVAVDGEWMPLVALTSVGVFVM